MPPIPTVQRRNAAARSTPAARLSDEALAPLDDSVHLWPGRHVQVGAARVHVRTTPSDVADAEPALFVHGLGGSAANWTDFAGVLRRRLAIESIDLPGHGHSAPALGNDYSPAAHVRVVIGYLEQSGRGPVHLVGNSMGGAVTIFLAAQRPDLVRTLTLISPAVPDRRPRVYPLRYDPRMALLVVPGLGGAAMKRVSVLPPERRVKATIALCFADGSRFPEARLREAVDEALARQAMPWANSAFLLSLRGLVRSQFVRGRTAWTAMRAITMPTLVLWGESDRLVAPDLAARVAAAIPTARLLVLDDVGHTAMMEDPVRSARALLALLEDAANK